MQNYNAIIDCFSTVKFGDKELLVVQNLFTNARLFPFYELNWQIGHGKWFTIAKFPPSNHSLSPSLTVFAISK